MRLRTLRDRLADVPDGGGARRWLADAFPGLASMTVLDLGGRVGDWAGAAPRPAHVHVVNLEPVVTDVPEWAEADHADACDLPPRILARRYDLVFSYSVLEHVGGYERRRRMAESVRMLAPRYWIQTPYRYFPVEPHWLAPGTQWLPLPLRVAVARRWPTPGRTYEAALRQVLTTELIGRTELRYLFPDAEIRTERMAGLIKSIIAVAGAG